MRVQNLIDEDRGRNVEDDAPRIVHIAEREQVSYLDCAVAAALGWK